MICLSAFARHKHKKKQLPADNIISVSIHHTACYGRCPDYTIEISNDGTVIYTATRFTPDTGIFRKNISSEKAMAIINKFNTYRVDTCRDIYRPRIADVPALIVTVKYNDSTKTIRDANFGPGYLQQLASEIDNAGRKTDDSWQKIGTPKTN
jgi:hypothetical protein